MDVSREMLGLAEPLREGVRFGCTQCGACCTGAPGRVRVTEAEIRALSEFRNESVEVFRGSETREVEGETLLREKANGECVLYEGGRCTVHAVKPGQCRRYPFWLRNVRSAEAWARTVAECPGIGEGERVSPEEIAEVVAEELSEAGRPSSEGGIS